MVIKSKSVGREKRKLRLKKKIRGSENRPRICVFKSIKHTYAQLICDESGSTIVSASTEEKDIVAKAKEIKIDGRSANSTKSVAAAKAVGVVIAERAKSKGVNSVVFDRNGYIYHGRIKAVADGAREAGLDF